MADNCIFCKIIAGDIPATIVHENEHVLAFRDVNPQAPTHVLIIPKKHISTINDIQTDDVAQVGHLFQAAAQVAKKNDLDQDGYRVVMNCNAAAGQTVFHIHLHLLGGKQMGWPPWP